MDHREEFPHFFLRATGYQPYPYQIGLAEQPLASCLLRIPTGFGKTAAVVLAWLWQHRNNSADTPRRFLYCLPTRVLVEQTREVIEGWLKNLGLSDHLQVHILLGGETQTDWEHPERPCILIGTQDMLLSRALNRGYAMSRFRWPIHFALLHNDCLWCLDEIQLMGDGLATSAQLAAFRECLGLFGRCPTIWMSATADPEWLATVDHAVHRLPLLTTSKEDEVHADLAQRKRAVKTLAPAPLSCRTPEGLASFVLGQHQANTQSLVVVNTVARAREVYAKLRREQAQTNSGVELHLLHSRFRPADRASWSALLRRPVGPAGRILVATQVIEAGVDLSALLLVTDLAPYASLVQRFGRVNRYGEAAQAKIFWVDRPLTEKNQTKLVSKEDLTPEEQEKIARPYPWPELARAAERLTPLSSASIDHLPRDIDSWEPDHVLRRQDLLDLFDTTPDLSGSDVDISRFVRGGEEQDLSVAWRTWEGHSPPAETAALEGPELCPVAVSEFRTFLQTRKGKIVPWSWDPLDGAWTRLHIDQLRPGLVVLLATSAGGYTPEGGWDGVHPGSVPLYSPKRKEAEEEMADDRFSFPTYTQTLADHSHETVEALHTLLASLDSLPLAPWRADLEKAMSRHDWGKAHRMFQATLQGCPESDVNPQLLLAKAGDGRKRHSRPYFRHELASALALIAAGESDLAAYLAAAHHGRVRMSIRAMPGEPPLPEGQLQARGIREGEELLSADVGEAQPLPPTLLHLGFMQLGLSTTGAPSWIDRTTALRDQLGVFRLAYLEALVRLSDERASGTPQKVLPPQEQKRTL